MPGGESMNADDSNVAEPKKKTSAARAKSTKRSQQVSAEADSASERMLDLEGLTLELDAELRVFRQLCLPVFLDPPPEALYLQLFHTLNGVAGMAINGRTLLGNTPTVIAGTSTRMRFGVVGMGSDVHTFHIHGHR